MKLLKPKLLSELPTETLLSRLRCRRSAINLVADHGVERVPEDAVNWVYQRLNRGLLKQLEPFLDLFAMRSLILMLRYSLVGEAPPAAVLRSSLLAPPLQRLAASGDAAEVTVDRLETALHVDYPFVNGLLAWYRGQGPGGVEQQFSEGILRHSLARVGRGVLKGVLCYLADMRNCLMIHKLWLWQVSQAPPLVPGGMISEAVLHRIWVTRDKDRLAKLVAKLAREPLKSDKTMAMEQCLLNGMTRLLRHAGRDPLGLGVIIDYFWRVQLATHNQMLRQTLTASNEERLEEVQLL